MNGFPKYQMPPKAKRQLPPIPPAFASKKANILASLAVPSSEYKDLSPKGSVDKGIVPLIEKINALDGVVTTSSCAGRVSVYLEGCQSNSGADEGKDVDSVGTNVSRNDQTVVAGGKGNGGRWLFVSHQPVDVETALDSGANIMEILGIANGNEQNPNRRDDCLRKASRRLVRLQFEPMILHIMTASLAHASSIVSAAMNAGFRESGVQSLKNLDDPMNAFPMVAVRTAGLALESVIGYVEGNDALVREDKENVHRLVGEDYLVFLLDIANERFQANEQRKKRFEAELFPSGESKSAHWETRESRQARKRADGLARKQALNTATDRQTEHAETDVVYDAFGLSMAQSMDDEYIDQAKTLFKQED